MKSKPPIYFTIQYEPVGFPDCPFRMLLWQRWNRLTKHGEKETEIHAQLPRDKTHGQQLAEALGITFGQSLPTRIWGLLSPVDGCAYIGGREEVESVFNRTEWRLREKLTHDKEQLNRMRVKLIGAPALMNIAHVCLDKVRQQYFDKWDNEYLAKLQAPPPPMLTKEQLNNLDGATLLGGDKRHKNPYTLAKIKHGDYKDKVRKNSRTKPETATERKERYREEAAELSLQLKAQAQRAAMQFPVSQRDRRHRYQHKLPMWMPPQPKPVDREAVARLQKSLGQRPLEHAPRILIIHGVPHRWEYVHFPMGHYVPAPELGLKGKQINFHEQLKPSEVEVK